MNQYFEGTLQLRNPTKEILSFIHSEVSKRPGVFISKESKLKKGVDMQLSSQKFLLTLGQMLQKKFGGELKTSRRLFTTKSITSKFVYRVNVFFRPLPFKAGQLIEYRGESFRVIKLGKKMTAKSLKTGRKTLIDYENLL